MLQAVLLSSSMITSGCGDGHDGFCRYALHVRHTLIAKLCRFWDVCLLFEVTTLAVCFELLWHLPIRGYEAHVTYADGFD